MTKVTNLSKATDLVKRNTEARIPKAEILNMLMGELNVSRSNAFVYFTKATKALGISVTKGESKAKKVAKTDEQKADEFFAKAAEKLAKKRATVTELTPAKKAKKVAAIDKVIADLKPQSPFAALGV
jgi:hypothetical protein